MDRSPLGTQERRYKVGDGELVLVQGSITDVDADAIVTAANTELQGGGGVDAAVHEAAGISLITSCLAIRADENGHRCPTGQARVTPGFDLCPWVIHAVGPLYARHSPERAEQLLRSAYDMALFLATTRDCASVALPAISAGVYGYPLAGAAQVAVDRAVAFMEQRAGPVQFVTFALVGTEVFDAFVEAANARGLTQQESLP